MHYPSVLIAILAAAGAAIPALAANPVPVTVHTDRIVGELRPVWNGFGYDEALTTLTPEGQHLLREVNKLSADPILIRVHHLLTSGDGTLALKWSSTNVYTEDAEGRPVYNWTEMDAILDELSRPGLEPFMQAGFMPEALSSQPTPYTPKLTKVGRPGDMVSGGAFAPPKDYRKWENLIEAWARHCGERYGVERASSWLWELWNEPESPYFRGSKEEYFQLYDHFAAGVKRALPRARVGGPHVTDPAWKRGDLFLEAFLEHCRSGENASTGAKGAPLDFVAFHAKGTTRLDDRKRVEMNLRNHLGTIDTYATLIARFPEFAKLPIYIGESDPEGCAACPATEYPERAYRLTSQFASYTVASYLREQDLVAQHGGDLRTSVTWAFTFAGQPWFNGLRALTTNQVALPVFNAFKLMGRLSRHRLAVENSAMLPTGEIIAKGVRGAPDIGVVATRDEHHLTIMLWNYHDVEGAISSPTEVALTLAGPAGERGRIREVREYAIDDVAGNAHSAWVAMGSPGQPTPEQIQALHQAAEMHPVVRKLDAQTGGLGSLIILLPPQSVKLLEIELAAPGASAPAR